LLKESYWNVIYNKYKKKYNIAKVFCFNGYGIDFNGCGEISIGEGSYIGEYSSIQSVESRRVIIGKNCAISHFVSIYTCNYDASEIIYNNTKNNKKYGDVIIGNNCWIVRSVLIKEGVIIGNNCVIGSNAVVTTDVSDNSIAVGVPAKVIKKMPLIRAC